VLEIASILDRVLRFALVLALVLGAAPAASATVPGGFSDTLVTTADRPTSLAFTPDGRLLIGGEAGTVQVYGDGGLVPSPALDIQSHVCSDSERGLMAVMPDPAFSSNHYIYVYYTFKKHGVCEYGSAGSTRWPVNRVSRFVLNDDNTVNSAAEVVLIDNIPAPEGYHVGADLHFGKDGFLYVSTGDGGCDYADPVWCDAQNDASRDEHVLLGKVLRITRDGGIPGSNPFQGTGTARCNTTGRTDPGKRCQETYAWGLRNPFRMAFDPNDPGTRFLINDVGEITWEEIDLGQAGADYGWNVREGRCAIGSTTNCGAPPAGMTNPIHSYDHDTGCSSITGGAFVPNGVWSPPFDGSYLFADLVCGKIFKLDAAGGGAFTQTEFATGLGPVVATTFGPPTTQGSLYYTTWKASAHEVRRIGFAGGGRYPRPGGGSPLRVPLVPSFAACAVGAQNADHVAPLNLDSCSPPAQASTLLTTSSSGRGSGSARFDVSAGNASTATDEADVRVRASITDVKKASDGTDYAGKGILSTTIRLTDRANGPAGTESATVENAQIGIPVDCVANADPGLGGACAVDATLDGLVPGFVREGKRSVVSAFTVRLLDAGADGSVMPASGACPLTCGSGDEKTFAVQGVFAP
jgi:glucose/arabinose dehydrogenase